jgi:hypothetical protein
VSIFVEVEFFFIYFGQVFVVKPVFMVGCLGVSVCRLQWLPVS